MLSIFRVTTNKNIFGDACKRLCKVSETNRVTQVAFITGRATRVKKPRPPPFPYKEKDYNCFVMDKMMYKMDENSKIITVEGPIAAGKDKFARQLAYELDMAYMPAPSFDLLYKNNYGYDLRSLNSQLPPNVQMSDFNTFLENPRHPNIAAVQLTAYTLKLNAYAESLLHLLSTGEGVVINRSHLSDYVFMKAMQQSGYVSDVAYSYYLESLEQSQPREVDQAELIMRPHLVIYLDVPVNTVQQRIKQRNRPIEVNSKALTTKYLHDIETIYKEDFLPRIEDHSHLLVYDWVTEKNMMDVVYDIENIVFNHDSRNAPHKLADWVFAHPGILDMVREYVSRKNRGYLLSQTYVSRFDVPELYLSVEEDELQQKVRETLPGEKYAFGFNADQGDKNILWKSGSDYYRNFNFPEVESSLYGSKQKEKQGN